MASKKIWVWVIVATTIVAAGVAGAFYLTGPKGPKTLPRDAVLVFAMPGEDQAVVAQLVVKVDTVAKKYTVLDPNKSIPIPGTSYDRLRDAYPFGGAELVSSALLGDDAEGAAWVDVSPEVWKRLMATGFDVDLAEGFQAFDETTDHYSQFELGPQRVAVEDLQGFVNGVPYTQDEARQKAVEQLAAASVKALSAARPGAGIESNINDRVFAELMTVLAECRQSNS